MLNIKGLIERGESFYNPFLNDVVEELERQGLAVKSEGATAVFPGWGKLIRCIFIDAFLEYV